MVGRVTGNNTIFLGLGWVATRDGFIWVRSGGIWSCRVGSSQFGSSRVVRLGCVESRWIG